MSDADLHNHASLAIELLTLYDEFAEYESYCAFFCDAVACMGSDKDNWLDDTSAAGLCLFSFWIKRRTAVLKQKLDVVRENARRLESS